MSFLSKILGAGKSDNKPDPKRYEAERAKAQSKSVKDRLKLAKSTATHPEILYYLAEDSDLKVRRAVASNPSTPVHASQLLAKDDDVDVKVELINRLSALLPDLSEDQYAHLYAYAAQALGVLALDEVLKVRLALSSALQDELYAPPEVVSQLAKDLERRVSEPVLKLCSAVPDEVLIDILQNHPEKWVVEAIAGRENLGEGVSSVVVKVNQTKAGEILIKNETAKLSDEAINQILNEAPEKPEWHKPLALQTHLPSRVLKDIVLFVDSSIQKMILNRKDIDDEVRDDLAQTVSRRVNFLIDEKGGRLTPEEKVKRLHTEGQLNDDAVKDALGLREHDFVYAALSVAGKMPASVVAKMIETGSAKAAIAVVWKAGFSMRTALEIQKTMAKIPPKELLYPKNGEDYPLSKEDLQWQVDFFAG